MKLVMPSRSHALVVLATCGLLSPLSLSTVARAWEPNARDRDAAIEAADLGDYFGRLSDRLDRRAPADPARITRQSMMALLVDREFIDALATRHFMAKVWGAGQGPVGGLNEFARADPKNREFLRWLMSDGRIMEQVMLARTPTAMFARIDDSHSIDGGTLATWREIFEAHPASRDGIYLKLAIATVLRPPGSANQGAGKPATPGTPLARFAHFLEAHQRGELAASFDTLNTWEMTHVVSACASDADLAWGREMVYTFLPQATEGERVVQLVSMVKRQGSQIPYEDMSCVLAGGGKCGPRSSFGVFINQAFGIPSIGVGQPGHAAVCWRDPRGDWQLGYGRGWHVSKVTDRYKMSGPEFVESAKGRGTPLFAQVEHLRWFAAVIEKPSGCYLPPADRRYANPRAGAVMELAERLRQSRGKIDTAPLEGKPDEISVLRSFEAPANDGEYYHARVRGFVHPPGTGDYVFSITSDDDSDLFLSSDEKAANKVFIAHVSGWSEPGDFSRKSQPITLERGRKYYIEAVHRELDVGDHLAVAWSGPGVSEGIIQGAHLSHPSRGEGCVAREVWRRPPESPAPAPADTPPAAKAEATIDVPPGVIHVEAEDFFTRGGTAVYGGGHPSVPVVNCHEGGKQLCFQVNMADAYVGYKIQVPKAGIYDLTARVAVVNWQQGLFARTFGSMPRPKSARVSGVYRNNVKDLGAEKAVDNDIGTRWAVNEGTDQAWLELDMGRPIEFSTFLIDERTWNRVSKFSVEYKDGDEWKAVHEGTNIGAGFSREFPPVMAQFIRLNILDCRDNGGPTIWEFSVGSVADGHAFINPEWSPATLLANSGDLSAAIPEDGGGKRRGLAGRWQTTTPRPIRLARGEQTIWLSAGFQRGLALRWFQLTPRGAE